MTARLKNKRTLITAAGQGIGLSTALAFANEGAEVVATDINPDTLESAVEKFQSEYMQIAKNRDPDEFKRKYKKLIQSGRWDEDQCAGKLT